MHNEEYQLERGAIAQKRRAQWQLVENKDLRCGFVRHSVTRNITHISTQKEYIIIIATDVTLC